MNTSKIATEINTLAADNDASVERMRKDIADAVVRGTDAKQISSMVNSLAHLEGFGHMVVMVQTILNNTGDINAVQEYMLDSAIIGARDTASGRGGDVTRSQHEGSLAATREIRDAIRWN